MVEGDDQVSRRVGEKIEMVDRNLQDRSRSGIDQKGENSQNGWVRNEGEVWGNESSSRWLAWRISRIIVRP